MAKRFIDTSKYRQAWRKLDPRFRAAYAWLVENADAAGFWVVDLDFFKFECGYALELDKFIKAVGGAVVRHGLDKINLVDFIQVNYGELKEGYNPHKPALRALHSSTLTGTTSSLNQAWPKLEDEEEDEEEDVSKKKEHAIEIRDERFEALWKTYQGKGAKGKARDYWAKLNEEDRAAIIAKAPAYVASTMDDRLSFRKNLEGWINPAERRWEAPVITQMPATNGQRTQTQAERDAELDRITDQRYAGY